MFVVSVNGEGGGGDRIGLSKEGQGHVKECMAVQCQSFLNYVRKLMVACVGKMVFCRIAEWP